MHALKNQIPLSSYFSEAWNLTDDIKDVSLYIAGFLERSLKKFITCTKCIILLEGDETSRLQLRKEYKSLTSPSKLIQIISTEAEKYFRFFSKTVGIFNKKTYNIIGIVNNEYCAIIASFSF